jgi:putative membrane protein
MKTSISFLFKHIIPAVLLTFLAMPGLQTARADQTNTQGQLSERDYKFVKEALKGGAMEVSLGQLAAQQGTNQSVRAFGERMVQDHQKANQELSQLASQKGATIPDTMDKKADEMAAKLRELSGTEFDKAYIKYMISDHKADIKEFQNEAAKADDADLKNWAAQTLPTLQEHLRMAENAKTEIDSGKPQISAQ